MMWTLPTRRNWNVWGDLDRLQREMNRAFEPFGRGAGLPAGEFPAVNIWTGEDAAVLTAEIPGVDLKDIEVTVKDNTVTIRGTRRAEAVAEGQGYVRQERGMGRFVRSFALPYHLESEKVEAEYRTGILRLTLPRAEADSPKRITVKAG